MAKLPQLAGQPDERGRPDTNRPRRPRMPAHRLAFDHLEVRQLLATITVNTASDSNSAGATLSLRQAIEIANGTLLVSSLTASQQAQVNGGLSTPSTIDFNVPVTQGPIYDIALTSALPAITNPVVINGYSQPGASLNTNGPGLGDNAVLDIVLDGQGAGTGANGLVVAAGGSTIEGLVIANFGSQSSGTGGNGIVLRTAGGNLIKGNFIGTNSGGTAGTPLAGDDVLIESGSSGNTVGGLTPDARNLLVNNNAGGSVHGAGVDLEGTSGNLVVGNFLGTDLTGSKGLAAGTDSMGVLIAAGATGNTVGGTAPSARNLISGNRGSGVQIGASSDTTATSGNVVAGNWIGTNVTGSSPLGNGAGTSPAGDGVDLLGANSIGNTIGGSSAAAGNLISANAYDGIYVDAASSDTLAFNLIGADAEQNDKNASMGNLDEGIELDNAPKITITNNLIVNNRTGGIALYYNQTENDLISGNEIILNNGDGILFCSCGNGGSAIYGNWIGTDPSGTANLGNQGDGIEIGTRNNTVGGMAAGQANVIAFNTKAGIGLEKLNTDTGNLLSANSIYSNGALSIDLGNDGVPIQDSTGGSQVGPNNLQNYPVLSSARASGVATTIKASLIGAANQTFTIQFFTSTVPDASGYGQAETYVGTTTVTTSGSGTTGTSADRDFTFVIPANLGGQWLSATATDQNGNTSELAKDVLVSSPPATTTTLAFSPGPVSAGQTITLTAVVASADGGVPSGDVTFLVAGQAPGPAVPLKVVNGQVVATLTTMLFTPGSYTITARYSGDTTYGGSVSNAKSEIVQPIASSSAAASVVSVQWVGNQKSSRTIVIQYDQAVSPTSARTTTNYTILTTGQHGRFGKGSKRIPISSAVYDATTRTVTLRTSRSLNTHQRYQLTVASMSSTGQTGTGGVLLSELSTGNYVTILDRHDYLVEPSKSWARVS